MELFIYSDGSSLLLNSADTLISNGIFTAFEGTYHHNKINVGDYIGVSGWTFKGNVLVDLTKYLSLFRPRVNSDTGPSFLKTVTINSVAYPPTSIVIEAMANLKIDLSRYNTSTEMITIIPPAPATRTVDDTDDNTFTDSNGLIYQFKTIAIPKPHLYQNVEIEGIDDAEGTIVAIPKGPLGPIDIRLPAGTILVATIDGQQWVTNTGAVVTFIPDGPR